MTRRNDTMMVGDLAEAEAERLLLLRGWTVTNLNAERRNTRLYDLRATKQGREILISVKHARAKRHIRLGAPSVFQDLRDEDYVIVFLPRVGAGETNLAAADYDVWVVPGEARHQAIAAHIHYYGDSAVAFAQNSMMIKDKTDRAGGRSISGAVFRSWEARYRDAWDLLS